MLSIFSQQLGQSFLFEHKAYSGRSKELSNYTWGFQMSQFQANV